MLQYITHSTAGRNELDGARAALAGGCRWIQLRMKDASDEQFMNVGRELAAMCCQSGATFIVDDRVHLVEPLGADGVHLGKNDMALTEARRILGPDKIIGATANTAADALRAINDGADYIGLGPFRFTTTKKNLSPVLGCEGLAEVMEAVRRVSAIPVVAIGGITEADIADICATGVSGVALSGVILNSPDPATTTSLILSLINSNIKQTEK